MASFFLDDGPVKRKWGRWAFSSLSAKDMDAFADFSLENHFPFEMSFIPRFEGSKMRKYFSGNQKYEKAFQRWNQCKIGLAPEVATHARLWDIEKDRFLKTDLTEKELYQDESLSADFIHDYILWTINEIKKTGGHVVHFTNPWDGDPSPCFISAMMRLVKEGAWGEDQHVLSWFNHVAPPDNRFAPRLLAEDGQNAVYAVDSISHDISTNDNYEKVISPDGESGFAIAVEGQRNKFLFFHSHVWNGCYPGGNHFFKLEALIKRLKKRFGDNIAFLPPNVIVSYYHQFRHTKIHPVGAMKFRAVVRFYPSEQNNHRSRKRSGQKIDITYSLWDMRRKRESSHDQTILFRRNREGWHL